MPEKVFPILPEGGSILETRIPGVVIRGGSADLSAITFLWEISGVVLFGWWKDAGIPPEVYLTEGWVKQDGRRIGALFIVTDVTLPANSRGGSYDWTADMDGDVILYAGEDLTIAALGLTMWRPDVRGGDPITISTWDELLCMIIGDPFELV